MESKQLQPYSNLKLLQLAHDLRSPLTALEVLIRRLGQDQQAEAKLLTQVLNRIKEIATELTGDQDNIEWQVSMLHELILQKQLEYPRVKIRSRVQVAEACRSNVPCGIVNRILSNLLNNAAEAIRERGRIFVRLTQLESRILVEIEDDGPGFDQGKSHLLGAIRHSSKSTGRGLGLYSASHWLNELGGSLLFGQGRTLAGARVSFAIPLAGRT
ncbi:MAG: ATP-binding protein [Bdellovibrionales bacterium]